jgi:sulfonate transport system substrate-binding protein
MLRRVFFRLFRPGATMEDHMRSGILQRGSRLALLGFAVVGLGFAASPAAAAEPAKIGIDYAYYNPVGLLMKDKSWLEQEFATPRIPIAWVYSAGSNKALEFLNGGAVDFGSSAGSAALLAKANGNPIKAV